MDKELISSTNIEWKKIDSEGTEIDLAYVTESKIVEYDATGEVPAEELTDENAEDLNANRFVKLANNSLRISNPTEQDIGTYKCFVHTPIDKHILTAYLSHQKDLKWLHYLIIIIICILIVLITIMCIVCVRKRSRRKGKYGVKDVADGKSRNR